ncbi:MAG: tetratricopeptide repeat protein [Blastocatellia bacterium]
MSATDKTLTFLTTLLVAGFCVATASAQTPVADAPPKADAKAQSAADPLDELRRAVEAATAQPARLRAARFAYAQALSQAGRDADAAAQYRQAIHESRGNDPVAYYNLGNAYARMQQNEQAAEAYRRAIEQRFNHYARASNNLGLMLVRLGRFDEARESFLKAIAEERGGFADAHYNLAQLYAQQGNVKAANAELAITLRLDSRHDDARLLAEQLKFDTGADRSSETVLAESAKPEVKPGSPALPVVKVTADTFRLLQQARSERARGNLTRAVTLYQSALREEGASVPAIEWELAAILSKLDNAREAEESYRRLIARSGDRYPMAYYYAGRMMMKQQKYGAAVVMLRQAITRVGEAPYIYLALLDSLEHLEDYEGAIQALEKFRQSRLARNHNDTDNADDEWYKSKMASLNEKKTRAVRQ